jgi:phenolic acid decarboxylase
MIKVKREWYSTHEDFMKALAQDLLEEVMEISEKTGIRPQYVVNKMFNVMYKETARMERERLRGEFPESMDSN